MKVSGMSSRSWTSGERGQSDDIEGNVERKGGRGGKMRGERKENMRRSKMKNDIDA
jgi:hypothetical protein